MLFITYEIVRDAFFTLKTFHAQAATLPAKFIKENLSSLNRI